MYEWQLLEHCGTHMDAPFHFSANGATMEAVDPGTLVAPLAVLDVREKAAKDPDYLVSPDDIMAWEKAHGRLPDGACVAMNAGWDKLVASDKFVGKDSSGIFHFPGFSSEAAGMLLNERNVVGIAVDTLSLDHGPSKKFKTHYLWLPSGRWGLENLANLSAVPPSGATIVVGAAKIKGATGGACRIFALV
jgi:kynurenine formamidase